MNSTAGPAENVIDSHLKENEDDEDEDDERGEARERSRT